MIKELRYTLLTDGSSDIVLLPILTWLLRENHVLCPIQPVWAELRRLPRPPDKLPDKIRWSLNLYPCDLLFVHRDAEKQPRDTRVSEIHKAAKRAAKALDTMPPAICVVPVRMQETWLLFDEATIRQAASNPRGRQRLVLPSMNKKLERLPDPKETLHDLLRTASGLTGRRRKKFNVHKSVHRVADLIDDFSPLRVLPAFEALEDDICQQIEERGWNSEPESE